MLNLVQTNDGKPVTNSLLVAQKFGKQHKHVLASIKEIVLAAENPAVNQMFSESTYTDERGKEQPMYIMDRDGFSLLVMGFTGKEAMKFKIDFISEFNKMEAHIKAQIASLSPAEMLHSPEEERTINARI